MSFWLQEDWSDVARAAALEARKAAHPNWNWSVGDRLETDHRGRVERGTVTGISHPDFGSKLRVAFDDRTTYDVPPHAAVPLRPEEPPTHDFSSVATSDLRTLATAAAWIKHPTPAQKARSKALDAELARRRGMGEPHDPWTPGKLGDGPRRVAHPKPSPEQAAASDAMERARLGLQPKEKPQRVGGPALSTAVHHLKTLKAAGYGSDHPEVKKALQAIALAEAEASWPAWLREAS